MTFNGTWKVDQNHNYENFLDALGFNLIKKKLGAHDNMKITLQQTGNNFHVKESSAFRSMELDFTLGVPFEYTLPNDIELSGSWNLEGDMMKGAFARKDNGKVITTTRKIVGDQLVQDVSYNNVEAQRIFKRT